MVSSGAPSLAAERWSRSLFGLPKNSTSGGVSEVNVHWQHTPISAAARRLSSASGQSIFLDRRLDPTTLISLTATDTPADLLRRALEDQPTGQRGSRGATWLGDIVYLGPQQTVRELRTLHARSMQQVAKLPPEKRSLYRKAIACEWGQLAEPAAILETLARRNKLELSNRELVPHDLWAAGHLPRAALGVQLTILLAGFDLQWQPAPNGETIEIQRVKRPVEVAAWHVLPRHSQASVEAFRRLVVGAKLEANGSRWLLTGKLEEHLELEQYLQGANSLSASANVRTRSPLENKRISLKVAEQPARLIVKQLARGLGMKATGLEVQDLDKRISIEVSQAPISEVLEQIGAAVGLSLSIQDHTLIVSTGVAK